MRRPIAAIRAMSGRKRGVALALVLAGLLSTPAALAQAGSAGAGSANPPSAPGAQPGPAAAPAKPVKQPTRYLPSRFAGRAGMYYKSVWGIDSLTVRWAESGELIRFSWRVLDPEKAKLLNDDKAQPSLIDPQAGVSLVIPVMEKVGQLRQTAPPQAGRTYWMVFSNAGRRVKQGDRVDVVVGTFRAENLMVD